MPGSKSLRLSSAAQAALLEATSDLPQEATTSQRILALIARLRALAQSATPPTQPATGGVTEAQLREALQSLRYQLLSDFADAG
jgi:hypothetical protein